MYSFFGIVGTKENLHNFQKNCEGFSVDIVDCNESFGVIPFTSDFVEYLNVNFHCKIDEFEPAYIHFPNEIKDLIKKVSHSGELGYIEALYHGGTGYQTGYVFYNGEICLQKENTENAINDVLKKLGVESEAGVDEFDTLGLGQYRSPDKWVT